MNHSTMHNEASATCPEISYQLVQRLIDTSRADVYLAHRKDGVRPVEIAVKNAHLDYDRDRARALAASMDADLQHVLTFDHPNLVRHLAHGNSLEAYPMEVPHYIIIMEYCFGGNLHAAAQFHIPAPLIQKWTGQIVDGLVYLHAQNVAHCDLTGTNILLNSPDWDTCQMKIGHLDTTERLHREMAHRVGDCGGRYAFMSPEMVWDDNVGRETDIWSLGCVVLEMISGLPHFVKDVNGHQVDLTTDMAAMYYVGSGGSPQIPHTLPEELRTFLGECLWRDRVLRPTSADLLTKDFLTMAKVPQWPDPRPQRD
ncbi:uncharacterized protein LOC129601020 [Paramacrobiotus metropolitanus]|uniref:uncharacterized protein LOC129601020 n=1 Tax=Paramacrobiotus metropolitanus TaxID=2943436 RepID=UPI002445AA5F|nr:uncharacterized protein LOC129601020 [Paramacrobiotus metropolitanus]